MSFTRFLRHSPAAALSAGLVVTHLWLGLAGTAYAQSALPADESQTQADSDTENDPASSTDAVSADAADRTTASTTEPLDSGITDPSDILDQQALQELRRQNLREQTIDPRRLPRATVDDGLGIRMGSFILRPSLTETIGNERETNADTTSNRSFLRSNLRTTLDSDWSIHRFRLEAEGSVDKTLSGDPQDDPEGNVQAELRLDLTDETTATLRAGYSLQREDIGDPNAVADATTQAAVNEYTASGELRRELGLIRTTGALELRRQTYSDVVLANGDRLSQADRDNNLATVRGRLGYELSPALIPVLEASYGRRIYDSRRDTLGYVRDADLYAAKAGLQVDLGEKLRGELSGGYLLAKFDDAALRSISAATVDGNTVWSPRRGTDLALNLRTTIEPTTTAGASGSTAYEATAVLSQIILENVTGQISSGLTLRDYSTDTTPVQTVLALGTGLTWSISRSLDMNADIGWERTNQSGAESYEVLRAGIGLTLKR